MKTFFLAVCTSALCLASCNSGSSAEGGQDAVHTANTTAASDNNSPAMGTGAGSVADADSKPNIVQVAQSNADFSTLVKAVQQAGLVNSLSSTGPFTVFAPTNAGFDKLPKGTLDDLMKPEKKGDLENILGYHTYVGVLDGVLLQDGEAYDMVYGGKVKITKDGAKTFVNGKEITGTVKASNGVVHVIDEVLLPPGK